MRRITKSGHSIGHEHLQLYKRTLLLSLLIRRINESDIDLTAEEQAKAIKAISGLPAYKMESLIPITGPVLADSIRKIISKNRAVNRTVKNKSKK